MSRLHELADLRRGVHIGSKQADASNGGELRAIKVKDIDGPQVAPAADLDRAYLPAEAAEKHKLHGGEILVALTGRNVKVALVGPAHAGCVVNQGLAVIRPRDAKTRKRVLEFLQSERGYTALSGLQTGVTIPSISSKALADIDIP